MDPHKGVFLECLIITELPAKIAALKVFITFNKGKFQGEIIRTVPTGSLAILAN